MPLKIIVEDFDHHPGFSRRGGNKESSGKRQRSDNTSMMQAFFGFPSFNDFGLGSSG